MRASPRDRRRRPREDRPGIGEHIHVELARTSSRGGRELRGVDMVSMIGWPTGTPRIGGFGAEHPERVERIVLFAPPPFFDAEVAPEALPEPGAPMLRQTRDRLEKERWLADVKCADQIDDDSVRDVMWTALMQADGLGASWKPASCSPNRMNFGWHGNVAKIKAPTLTLLGAQDYFERRHDAWKASTMEQKMLVKIACGAHYLNTRRTRKVLHEASKERVLQGMIAGKRRGMPSADANGRIRWPGTDWTLRPAARQSSAG